MKFFKLEITLVLLMLMVCSMVNATYIHILNDTGTYKSVVNLIFDEKNQPVRLVIGDVGKIHELANLNDITSNTIKYSAVSPLGGESKGSIETEKLKQMASQQPNKDILITFITSYSATVYPKLSLIPAKPSISRVWSAFPNIDPSRAKEFRLLANDSQKLIQAAKVLGVSQDAPQSVVRKAFLQLSLQWHPDKTREQDKKFAAEVFNIVNEAYKEFLRIKGWQ